MSVDPDLENFAFALFAKLWCRDGLYDFTETDFSAVSSDVPEGFTRVVYPDDTGVHVPDDFCDTVDGFRIVFASFYEQFCRDEYDAYATSRSDFVYFLEQALVWTSNITRDVEVRLEIESLLLAALGVEMCHACALRDNYDFVITCPLAFAMVLEQRHGGHWRRVLDAGSSIPMFRDLVRKTGAKSATLRRDVVYGFQMARSIDPSLEKSPVIINTVITGGTMDNPGAPNEFKFQCMVCFPIFLEQTVEGFSDRLETIFDKEGFVTRFPDLKKMHLGRDIARLCGVEARFLNDFVALFEQTACPPGETPRVLEYLDSTEGHSKEISGDAPSLNELYDLRPNNASESLEPDDASTSGRRLSVFRDLTDTSKPIGEECDAPPTIVDTRPSDILYPQRIDQVTNSELSCTLPPSEQYAPRIPSFDSTLTTTVNTRPLVALKSPGSASVNTSELTDEDAINNSENTSSQSELTRDTENPSLELPIAEANVQNGKEDNQQRESPKEEAVSRPSDLTTNEPNDKDQIVQIPSSPKPLTKEEERNSEPASQSELTRDKENPSLELPIAEANLQKGKEDNQQRESPKEEADSRPSDLTTNEPNDEDQIVQIPSSPNPLTKDVERNSEPASQSELTRDKENPSLELPIAEANLQKGKEDNQQRESPKEEADSQPSDSTTNEPKDEDQIVQIPSSPKPLTKYVKRNSGPTQMKANVNIPLQQQLLPKDKELKSTQTEGFSCTKDEKKPEKRNKNRKHQKKSEHDSDGKETEGPTAKENGPEQSETVELDVHQMILIMGVPFLKPVERDDMMDRMPFRGFDDIRLSH